MYRAYIRTHDQRVLEDTKTVTADRDAAAAAFEALVNRADLDGKKFSAVLSYGNRQIAFHRFDRPSGSADYWRDKLDEIEWPTVGRPVSVVDGKRVNVYLDPESLSIARRIGDGAVSEGIRLALKSFKQ